MIEFKDFQDENGKVNWAKYDKAQIDNGEKCLRCGALILRSKNVRTLCFDCKSLDEEKGKVSHDSYIRCPKCSSQWDPQTIEQYDAFQDGEHDVICPECEHRFEIITYVTYTFISPAMEGSK
jgi:DNA-directed RNA polymerase subunit RPC12/RpoP